MPKPIEFTSKWMDESERSYNADEFEEMDESEWWEAYGDYVTTGSVSFTVFEEIDESEWRTRRVKHPKDSKRIADSEWRRGKYLPYIEDKNGHISILVSYIRNLSSTCHFQELPLLLTHPPSPPLELKTRRWPSRLTPRLLLDSKPRRGPSRLTRCLPLLKRKNWSGPSMIKQYLKQALVVPRLKQSHQMLNQINKFHLLQAFLSLLVQLLYHKTHLIVAPFKDGIENLENDLRFLLTILGDISSMLCHTNHFQAAQFQNPLPEFEAVANQAGSFVHYLFFTADRAFETTDEGLAAVLKHVDLLKTNLWSCVSIPAAYTTPTTSVVDSILILYSLVDDLEDLLKREDDPIADVKDQVNLLHHELLLSHSSIKDMRSSPQNLEIEELKEALMCVGGIAHQAEYLITSFMVKDAPLWYVFNRLTHLYQQIELRRTKLQVITQKYQFGGLKVEKYNFNAEAPLQSKRNAEVNDVTVGFEYETTEILDQLVGGETQSLQIISILGMGGLGKTTLANKLYNHPSVSDKFDRLDWCVVSQTYKIPDILGDILFHINNECGKEKILEMEEISLVEHIHKTLIGRRYLIVLDDIWDSNVLNELLRCFPDDGNGSRILLTSRNKDVAPLNSKIHDLPFLSNDQCWELLKMKVFGSRTYSPELQRVGKRIAARCCGIPLAVVVTAGLLSSVDEEERTWEELDGNLGSFINGEDNSVMQILELSYKHLPIESTSKLMDESERSYNGDEFEEIDELERSYNADEFEEVDELEWWEAHGDYVTTGSVSFTVFEEIDESEWRKRRVKHPKDSKRIADSEWRRGKYLPYIEDKNGHISILVRYIRNLSSTCHFQELPLLLTHPPSPPLELKTRRRPSRLTSCLPLRLRFKSKTRKKSPHRLLKRKNWSGPSMIKQYLKEVLVVPRLKEFHQTQNQINKFHLVQAFLSLLLQLLFHKTPQIVDQFKDRIENLEKELRFFLTVLGDGDISWIGDISMISWVLYQNDKLQAAQKFQNPLPEFEAVANQAGSFVHYLFFTADQAFETTDEGLAAVLKLTDLLKAKLQSSVSIQSFVTVTTPIVNSILILDSVVSDLEDLLKREDDRIADLKDQVNLLHHELLLSHSAIKYMRSSPQNLEIEELKEALMCVGGIAHQAEYLITSFMVKDAPLWYVFNRLTHLNQQIELRRTKLQVITQKYQFGGLKVEKYNFNAEAPLQSKRNTEVNDVTVGFEYETTEILDQLVGGETQSLQIISILGMPGLGKTTLANKLYNHPSVSDKFDRLAWCVVSQTYKIPDILGDILFHINNECGKEKILEMEEISLVEHIHKTLIGRRYLIVLDDIWDSNVLNELLRCFPDDGNGSRILLTSRNKDVAPRNSKIHDLPFLSNDQCWELLKMKVFGSRTYSPELQRVGKRIAARCCGLPLTVVVTAGVLSSVDEEERTWEELEGNLGSYINGEDNSVMQILELSYKHLPDRLKPCFLYFGEFKEDKEISVGKLKRLWVAEGFICKEKDKSVENIAGEYLMELIDRSLVMIAQKRTDGRGAKSCVVHDLLRDLCLKISNEEGFLIYASNDYHTTYGKVHRVRADGDAETLGYCQNVRSFVGDRLSNPFYVRDMKVLRVLHFNSIYGREIPIFGLEYLVNLRYLVIQTLPTWIERLVNLEYIRVDMEWKTVYLPPTIVKMKKLRYLRAPYAEYGEDWNISNQTNNLQYLSNVTIKTAKDEELLKCSSHLRKLKCNYYQEGMEKSAYPHFDLRFLAQLDSLTLIFSPPLFLVELEEFGFPSKIRELMLDGSGLPWEKMSIVGSLEFLEVLKLYDDAFQGERWDTRDGEFQNLRFLQLQKMKLAEWNVASTEHFPKLRQLILSACSDLEEIPCEIGEISTLELIHVKFGCQNSLVESAERIKEEQRDMGNEELRVIISKLQ